MFAAHLPVDGLLWTCADLISATDAALARPDPTARDDYFGKTAERIYLSYYSPSTAARRATCSPCGVA
jgi:predicted TIM-barrel fold metal-dependent hydrolase